MLGTVSGPRLIAFLTPWSDYLALRGFILATSCTTEFDYQGLGQVLMSPDASTPGDMIDALYHVSDVSGLEAVEELQAKVATSGLAVTRDHRATALDFAIDVWNAAPDFIRRHHAESVAQSQQAFDYSTGCRAGPWKFPSVPDSIQRTIEAAFDDWFEAHNRGRGCRLIIVRQPDTVWLVIRHGNLMRREASHEDDGTAGTAFYRPQLHDVLVYDETADTIGIHTQTKGSRKLYLRILGGHLFGDPEYFQPIRRYTLAPLIDRGAEALACEDIVGLEHVTLVETQVVWGGRYKEKEIHRANDIFAAAEQRGLERIASREPVMAAFTVKFTDSPRERRVVIRTPASARYDRNEDGEIIETWLRARGFLLPRPSDLGRQQ